MPVQRRGVELRQDVDAAQPRVDAVRNRNVHQPIFPGQRHRRLGAFIGEGKQPRPGPAPSTRLKTLLVLTGIKEVFSGRFLALICGHFRPNQAQSQIEFARIPCAESSVTSAEKKPLHSFSKDCAGWNIAATTARASASCGTANPTRQERGKNRRRPGPAACPPAAAGSLGHRTHALGHTRAAVGRELPIPHFDQAGAIAVVHNGVIENYERLRAAVQPGTRFSPTPTRKCWPISSAHSTAAPELRHSGRQSDRQHPLVAAVWTRSAKSSAPTAWR